MNKFVLLIVFFTHYLSISAQPPEFDADKNRKRTTDQIISGQNIDIKYSNFHWYIDPNFYFIKGSVSTHFVVNQENTSEIIFDLSSALHIDSIVFQSQKMEYKHLFNFLTIKLNKNLTINQFDSVRIHYQGVPNSADGAFEQSYHNNTPIIWTLSEPFGAKDWFPCKQNLNDKIDSIDITIYTPTDYRAASNGMLINDEVVTKNGKSIRINHWKHRYPIESYLIAFAVTNYVVYEEMVWGKDYSFPVINYVYPEVLETAKEQTARLLPVFNLFDSLFMPYPFLNEKYGHAQFNWGGGMEHQTMTFAGNFSFGLLTHELAHQWFGDYVTCGSWADIWLNEGFATYAEGIAYQNGLGDMSWSTWLESRMNTVMDLPYGAVYVDDTTSVSRIFSGRLSYSKGAMVLHTLRGQIGDNAFFGALRNYLADSKVANGYAKSEDLIAHFEAQADTSLSEFFNDWLYSEGFPTYALFWEQAENREFLFNINQLQSSKLSSFFEMNIPIRFSGEGKDTLIWFQHSYSGQEFVFYPNFKVSNIEFDPNRTILTKRAQIINRNDMVYEPDMKIFPNPVSNDVSVLFHKPVIFSTVDVYNDKGQKLKSFANSEIKRFYMFNLEDLPSGSYYMVFRMENDNIVKKVVRINESSR